MPLTNFICSQENRQITMEGCQKCCNTWMAECELIPPVLDSIIKGIQEEQAVKGIRVTSLTGCIRQEFLKQKIDYAVSPENLHYQWRGRLMHSLLENSNGKGIIEKRFERKFHEITITGKPDLILPEEKILVDFKSTISIPQKRKKGKGWPRIPWSNHIPQVNLYRWLIDPIQVDRLLIFYVDMKSCAVCEAPILSEIKLNDYFVKALAIKEALESDIIPPPIKPGTNERWQCDYCDVSDYCYSYLYYGINKIQKEGR